MPDYYEHAITKPTPPAPANTAIIADVTMTSDEYRRLSMAHPLKFHRMEKDLRWLGRAVARDRRKRGRG